MMHETDATSNKKGRKRRGPTRFPGINKDAKELGVNRATLYRMLAGYPGFKDLKTLRVKYEVLLKKKPEHTRNYILSNIANPTHGNKSNNS